MFVKDDLGPCGCRVPSSEAKFSGRLCMGLYMLEQSRRALKCCSWLLLLSLWGFPNISGCSQQVVQGCVILLSIFSKLPLPSHPPPSQAWCKYVAYSFRCFIQFMLHPSEILISGLMVDFFEIQAQECCVWEQKLRTHLKGQQGQILPKGAWGEVLVFRIPGGLVQDGGTVVINYHSSLKLQQRQIASVN